MTEKFKAGDRVRIAAYDEVDRADGTEWVKTYDKEGWITYIDLTDKVYVVAPSSVMPISYMAGEGNTVFYPLSEGENSHARKFYVAEDKLELVEDDEDDLDIDDEEDDWTDDDEQEVEVEKSEEKPEAFADYDMFKNITQVQQSFLHIQSSIHVILNELNKMLTVIGQNIIKK